MKGRASEGDPFLYITANAARFADLPGRKRAAFESRQSLPARDCCCALALRRQPEAEHKAGGHLFKRDMSLPEWHGWRAFRRRLATNLHDAQAKR